MENLIEMPTRNLLTMKGANNTPWIGTTNKTIMKES